MRVQSGLELRYPQMYPHLSRKSTEYRVGRRSDNQPNALIIQCIVQDGGEARNPIDCPGPDSNRHGVAPEGF